MRVLAMLEELREREEEGHPAPKRSTKARLERCRRVPSNLAQGRITDCLRETFALCLYRNRGKQLF